MGSCFSIDQKISPTMETSEEKLEPTEGIEKNRTCTDVIFIIIMSIFLLVFIILLSYCMSYGDIYRIINGYDDCANVCGKKNTPDVNLPCKGAERTNDKFLLIENTASILTDPRAVHRICVPSCEGKTGYKQFINRCIPEKTTEVTNSFFSKTGISNFFQEVSEDLQICWEEILYLCLIAFVFSLVILLLFRYVVGFVVWLVLIGIVLASICGTIFLWIKWHQESKIQYTDDTEKHRTTSYLVYAILATILTIGVCLIILVLRKRIRLVIQLFKEAGKAIATMPLILIEPILTFVSLGIIIGLWLYFAIWIESAGFLKVESNMSAKYERDSTMQITRWYNLLALFWFSQFVIGCQHMIIAGSVAAWFFTRNKSKLSYPILTSCSNLVRYHLGTVAFGSFLIAVIQIIRVIFKVIEYSLRDPDNKVTKCLFNCCQCCLACFERLLQYLTRNAYIETAMNGYSFCTAGKKAFLILANNALRVFAINSVGDFVLLLGKALVVLSTVLIGMELIQKKEGVHYTWIPLLLVGIFAYLVSHCFITVFEMTIDTIFLCFCEDCERNDGITRPYFMSRGLMEFVQNSKKVLEIQELRSGKAWSDNNSSAKKIITVSEDLN